jgi:hypothetical protein
MASLDARVTSPDGKPVDWAEDTAQLGGQLDGASTFQGGGTMAETEYDVAVKLIDPNSPLTSIKTFEELGLYVHK